jgi:hypothetical protein
MLLGLDGPERGVGEDGVVAPGSEQLALPGGRFGVEVLDAADDQPDGNCLPLTEVKVVYSASATWASETQRRS